MKDQEINADITAGRNRMAATIVAGHMIKHLYNGGFGALIMPQIKIDLGLNFTQFGILATSRSLTGWLSNMYAGYLGDRFTDKSSLFLGLSLTLLGVAHFIIGFSQSYLMMLGALLLLGIGPSMFHPFAVGEMSRRFPERRGFAVSLHGMGGISGEVLGPLVFAGLLTLLVWRDLLKISIIPALIMGLGLWLVLRSLSKIESQAASRQAYLRSLGTLLRNPMLAILVASTALRSIGEGAVEGFLPVYLKETLSYSDRDLAITMSLAQVVGLMAQPIMGFASDRFGRKIVLAPAALFIAVASILLAFAGPTWVFALVVFKGAFKFSLHHIHIAAAIDATEGKAQSTVTSLMYGAGIIGIFSPSVAGMISDSFGIQSAFLYGGSAALLAFVVLMFFKNKKRDPLVNAAEG